MLAAAGLTAVSGTAPAAAAPSAVADVNPDSLTSGSLFGGRTVAFSTNPVNTQIVFAATEFGGLFRSSNHGSSWSHVDQVPLTAMQDVQVAASDANLVIATGAYDGSIDNRGGGIWRSTDGGSTWSQPATANVCPTTSQNNARKVAIAPGSPGSLTVYVGTDCGLARSTDSGQTWTRVQPGAGRFWDVKVRNVATPSPHLQVDTCGDGGYFRSNDGGSTWPTNTAFPASGFIPCRVATAPQDPNTVFLATRSPVVNPGDQIGETLQFESDDAGVNWTNLNVSIDGNGRDPSVIVAPAFDGAANHFEVFFMTDQVTMHQTCDTNNAQRCASGAAGANTATCGPPPGSSNGAWTQYDSSIPHCAQDPGDLALDPSTGCPFLQGGDGGIFQTANGCTDNPTFTNANAGLHAQWVYQVATTAVTSGTPHTDVYYGMQDNGQVCSNDDAATFHSCGGADVFNTLADPTGPPSAVLKNQNGGFSLSAEDGTTALGWTSPSDPRIDGVTQFGNQRYAFIVDNNPPPAPPVPTVYQVKVTTDDGSTYTQVGPNLPGPASTIVASGTAANPVFYLNISVGGTPTIYRLSGPLNGTATLTPANNGLVTPGTFNVDPVDPLKLYVVDTGSGNAKFSTNGGQSWAVDNNLSTIVTKGGAYPFQTNAGGPNISSFGFDPSSDTVLAGTNYTGIYASADGGGTWTALAGSQQVPRVGTFAFDRRSAGVVYVGSTGRGVWRIGLPTADLSVTKTHSPDPVIAGNQLTYTLTVTNNGPNDAPDAAVVDTLPAQATYLTNNLNPPAGCTAVGQLVSCALGDLASGQSVTFKIVTLIDPDTVADAGGPTSITNKASTSSGAVTDSSTSNNTAIDTALVNDAADLQATKVCKPDTTVLAGTPLDCQVFVDNHGPSKARSVVVDDTLLSSGAFTISNVSVSPGPTSCTTTPVTGGQKVSCATGDLAAASTSTSGRVTLSYRIAATEGQDIGNVATTHSDTPDPDNTNNQSQVNLTVTSLADLALSKTGPASVTAGTPISWTMSVHNNGPSMARNVAISDNVPAGVAITSVTMPGASCVAGVPGDSSRPTICTFGSLAAGATSATMTVGATVGAATTGALHNDARVSSDTFDNNSTNQLAHSDTTVNVVSSLSVTKVASAPSVVAGTPLSYKITVANAGPSTATSVTLSDPLPAGETFTSTGGVGTCGYNTNTNTVSCQLPSIDPGQSEVVFIYTGVKSSVPPGSIDNTATATAVGSPDAQGSTSTTVTTSADLGVLLTSDKDVYKPSTDIHYTVTVTNAGPSDAQSVLATVQLPPAKSGYYVSNNGGCSVSGTLVTCALGTVFSGSSRSWQINWHAQGNKGLITSTATVSSPTSDPNSGNNSSTRNVTVK